MATDTLEVTNQYLDFHLGEEVFAVDVGKVREVLDLTRITRVPRMPESMRGVINLRGSVVSVIDMRAKFGMPATEATVDTVIIVVEVNIEGETTVLGALVDAVREVFELDTSQIEPAPRIGTAIKADFIAGMGKKDDSFVILLDVDKVFSAEDMVAAEEAVRAAESTAAPAGENDVSE